MLFALLLTCGFAGHLEVLPKPKLLFRLLSCSSFNCSLTVKVTSSLSNHLQVKTWFIQFSCEHKTQLHSFRFSINLLVVIWVNTLQIYFISVGSDDTLYLLATCFYQAGYCKRAYSLLQSKGCPTPLCRFLFAKCCMELDKYVSSQALKIETFLILILKIWAIFYSPTWKYSPVESHNSHANTSFLVKTWSLISLIITITISSNAVGASAALCFTNHPV